ncbi:IS3 family transposase [Streptomyces sp. NBC_01520]|uniref:IS3 family transposase n=1 Tax=Streptomyces sp. NBC_01520 TaxID=2903892 RepID=UPI00386C8CF2
METRFHERIESWHDLPVTRLSSAVVRCAWSPRCATTTRTRRPLWKTLSQVELATAEWVDWYCHRRLHGEIGHVPPVEYETNHYMKSAKPQVTTTI